MGVVYGRLVNHYVTKKNVPHKERAEREGRRGASASLVSAHPLSTGEGPHASGRAALLKTTKSLSGKQASKQAIGGAAKKNTHAMHS